MSTELCLAIPKTVGLEEDCARAKRFADRFLELMVDAEKEGVTFSVDKEESIFLIGTGMIVQIHKLPSAFNPDWCGPIADGCTVGVGLSAQPGYWKRDEKG